MNKTTTSIAVLSTLLMGAGIVMPETGALESDLIIDAPVDDPNIPEPNPGTEPPPAANEIPWPAHRVGLVREGDTTRWVHLVRCVGVAGTCSLTTQSAPVGSQWTSDEGPNYVKLADGTWAPYRSQAAREGDRVDPVVSTVCTKCQNGSCLAGACRSSYTYAYATAPAPTAVVYSYGGNSGGGGRTFYRARWGTRRGLFRRR